MYTYTIVSMMKLCESNVDLSVKKCNYVESLWISRSTSELAGFRVLLNTLHFCFVQFVEITDMTLSLLNV